MICPAQGKFFFFLTINSVPTGSHHRHILLLFQWPIQGGPGPPTLGKSNNVKGPHKRKFHATTPPPSLNRVGFGDPENSATTPPPTESRRLWRPQKILLLPPPPTESRRLWRSRKNSATTPPTESRRLGTSHERGRLLRKILDLRLLSNTCYF